MLASRTKNGRYSLTPENERRTEAHGRCHVDKPIRRYEAHDA
jgi:hypothetical protein